MEIKPEIDCKICGIPQLNPLGYLTVPEQLHIAANIDMFEGLSDENLIKELMPDLQENEIELLSTGVCDECRAKL